jgi:hypothetical protein
VVSKKTQHQANPNGRAFQVIRRRRYHRPELAHNLWSGTDIATRSRNVRSLAERASAHANPSLTDARLQ